MDALCFDLGPDPAKWRKCSRIACRKVFKRRRRSVEKRGHGGYCSRACKSQEWWDEKNRAPRMELIGISQGRLDEDAQTL